MDEVVKADVGSQLLVDDSPEAQAARRRALEQALNGVRASRRARKPEPPAATVRQLPERVGPPGDDADEPGGDAWPLVSTLPWIDRARCQEADPSLFFGLDLLGADGRRERPSERLGREAAAKVFCAACPVRAQCAEHALALPEPYGVWGGMGEMERLALLRRTVA